MLKRAQLKGTEESILVPVYTKVIKDLLHKMGLPKDTRMITDIAGIEYKNENWIINGKDRDDMFGPHNRFLGISIDEEYKEESLVSGKPYNNSNKPILVDKPAQFSVRPWGMDVTVNMEVGYFTKSKSEMNVFLSKMRSIQAYDKVMAEHTVDYLYYPPVALFQLISDILTIKMKTFDIYKDEKTPFVKYLDDMSDHRLTVTSNLSLSDIKAEVAVREKQSRIIGLFTNSLMEMKKEYDADKGYWGTTFNYTFTFNKIDALDIDYSHVVFNKPLPSKWQYPPELCKGHNSAIYQGVDIPEHYFSIDRIPQVDAGILPSYLEKADEDKLAKAVRESNTFIRVPECDVHSFYRVPYYTPVIGLLLSVDNKEECLLNLTEIPEYSIKPEILQYLKDGGYKTATKRLEDIFYVEVRANGEPIHDEEFELTPDLCLKSLKPLDLTKTYRAYLHVLNKPQMLGKEKYFEIFTNKKQVNKITPDGVTKPIRPEVLEMFKDVISTIDPKNPKAKMIPALYIPEETNWYRGYYMSGFAVLARLLDKR